MKTLNEERLEQATPLGCRIMVRMEGARTVSAGGIVIPDDAQTPTQVAKVVSIGKPLREPKDGGLWDSLVGDVQPGQTVVLSKFGLTDVEEKLKLAVPSCFLMVHVPDAGMFALGRNVLIRMLPREVMTSGGLHIPDTAKEVHEFGIVAGVGTAVKTLRRGSRVYVARSQGTLVTVDGEEMIVMDETKVKGIIGGVSEWPA